MDNVQIEGVPDCDVLEVSPDGEIYLHMACNMTPEQLQLIVDYAKKVRRENG